MCRVCQLDGSLHAVFKCGVVWCGPDALGHAGPIEVGQGVGVGLDEHVGAVPEQVGGGRHLADSAAWRTMCVAAVWRRPCDVSRGRPAARDEPLKRLVELPARRGRRCRHDEPRSRRPDRPLSR